MRVLFIFFILSFSLFFNTGPVLASDFVNEVSKMDFNQAIDTNEMPDASGLLHIKLDLSAPPVPGTTVELTASVMADIYAFEGLEYIFSIPPDFKVKGPKRGFIKQTEVWNWKERTVFLNIPKVLGKKSIYFLVKGTFSMDAVCDWLDNDESLEDSAREKLKDRLESLDEKIELGNYLDITVGPGECYFGKPAWSALFTGDRYALITNDPGIDAENTEWTAMEISDQKKALAKLDVTGFKYTFLKEKIRSNRYTLLLGRIIQNKIKKASQIVNQLLEDYKKLLAENKDKKASKSVHWLEKIQNDKRLEYVLLMNVSAILENNEKMRITKFKKIISILEGPFFEKRYEKELVIYIKYNLGLTYLRLKKYVPAKNILKDVLKECPRLIAAEAALRVIQSIEK